MEYRMPYKWALPVEARGLGEEEGEEGEEGADAVTAETRREMERAVKAYTAFGELVVNRKLVPWWYRIHAGGRLVALSKEEVKEGEEPKARPIAVGMVDRDPCDF